MSGAPEIDPDHLAEAIGRVNRRMASHAGGIQLVEVDRARVRVEFTGMCRGCRYKALTMAGTISPILRDVAGVDVVEAPGARVSPHAAARLDALLHPSVSAD